MEFWTSAWDIQLLLLYLDTHRERHRIHSLFSAGHYSICLLLPHHGESRSICQIERQHADALIRTPRRLGIEMICRPRLCLLCSEALISDIPPSCLHPPRLRPRRQFWSFVCISSFNMQRLVIYVEINGSINGRRSHDDRRRMFQIHTESSFSGYVRSDPLLTQSLWLVAVKKEHGSWIVG